MKRLAILLVTLAVTPAAASVAPGDNHGVILHLKDGGAHPGVLRSTTPDGNVWLERDVGVTVSYARGEIASIEHTETRLSRLYARASEIEAMEELAARLPARRALAVEAAERGFPQFARQQAHSMLAEADATRSSDPELLASAHAALGHVLHDGVWMTEAEAWRARGYVKFGGRWIPAAERERMLAERAADRRHRAELRLQRQRFAAERQAASREPVSVFSDSGSGYGYRFAYGTQVRDNAGGTHRRRHGPTTVRQLWDTPWWADTVHARSYGTIARGNRGGPFHRSMRLHAALPGRGGGGAGGAPRGGRR